MKFFYSFFLGFVFLTAGSTRATTHTITFGDYFFSPSTLNVSVGDTILWSGTFGVHTATSTSVPSGAASFDFRTGTTAMYVVTVAGTYSYDCIFHASFGMTGSFTAAAAGVENPQPVNMMMDPLYPNPAMDEAMVHFTLDKPEHVTLRIYNSTGTLVQTPTNEEMSSGFHMLMIDTKQLASGSYQYVLQAGDAVLARAM
ncbi:MAG TPA: T9SS type A sorting domain-containing protein, partial [Candidatus Kapabacteria bacterium]|nr:T9SS type A sorting domain-containing protein [Candidatus Kapabacteria bacterium]